MKLARLTGIALVSADARPLAAFYRNALGFQSQGEAPIPADEMALLGLSGGGLRIALTLGETTLTIDQFDQPSAPYPMPCASNDPWFQHFAVRAPDIATAWARVLAAGADPISQNAPVRLPANTGQVVAAKFRDPEGHPLELLHNPAQPAVTGIDHSAIVVSDIAASIAFYTALGLLDTAHGLNHGPEQAALDALMGPTVDVVALTPIGGDAHLELLHYRTPAAASPNPVAPNDIAATRLIWGSDVAALARDPDGHLHQTRAD